ncbi:MAG: thioesterase family protein [Pseudomonadota bacterium]
MQNNEFVYSRVLQFYETDAMGIIHHANYLLFMEEARLQFLRRLHGDCEGKDILKEINFPLVSCSVDYKKSLHFNETLNIKYRVSTEGARLVFDYEMSTKSFDKPVAFGKTVHVTYDMNRQRATKLPDQVLKFLGQ